MLRWLGRRLEALNKALLERFPEEWVAIGSEGFSVATSLALNALFHYLLLTLFQPEVSGLYFAGLGFAYITSLVVDLGYMELAARRLMEREGFPRYTAMALSSSILSSLVGAALTDWSLFPFLTATMVVGYMAMAYHNMGEYAKRLLIDSSFSLAKVSLLLWAYLTGEHPYLSLSLSALVVLPYIRYVGEIPKALREALEAWREGLSARWGKVFATITGMGDSAFLHLALGPKAVAAYNILTFLPKKAAQLSGKLALSVLPIRAREGKKLNTWALAVGLYLLITLPFILFPQLYKILFPQGPYSPWVLALGVALPLAWVAYGELYRRKAFERIGAVSIVASFVTLGLWALLYSANLLTLEGLFLSIVVGYTLFTLLGAMA